MILREPWRTRLLFLSVAVNLFAAALIGGFLLLRPPPHRGPPGWTAMIEHMTRDMPQADAERFRTVMGQARPQTDQARARMDHARRALARAIARTPYDEEGVRQAMHEWQTAWQRWSDVFGTSLMQALSGLSPDGRRRFAEAGLRPPPPSPPLSASAAPPPASPAPASPAPASPAPASPAPASPSSAAR